MITADYHTHTSFSSDSKSSLESMIEEAIRLGLKRICITDHMDYDYPTHYNLPFIFDPEAYVHQIKEVKDKYKNQIQVLMGIECGIRPYLADRYNQLINAYDFDFVIASSHLAKDMDVYYPEYWEGITEEEGYRIYFETILQNLNSFDNFDVYGHLDYVVRYGPSKGTNFNYALYKDVFDEILKKIIAMGKGIEANTAGYKYGFGRPHPTPEILKRYKELGGTILTIGSDGHRPEHLAYDFNQVQTLLKELGFTKYTVFENRQPIFLDL